MILDNATAHSQAKAVPSVLHLNNRKSNIFFCSRQGYDYSLVHRFYSIGKEVHQNLVDLALVSFHRRQMDIEFQLDSSETLLRTDEVNHPMHKEI